MRRPVKNRNKVTGDKKYNSLEISKFINYVMWDGKKNVAETIVYGAIEGASAKLSIPAIDLFKKVMDNVAPVMEVRARRIGGANYQVPREVRPERRTQLALRWIIDGARSKKGKPMVLKLEEELMLAYKNEGNAVKKREDTHKMAEANRAFAHFAF